MNDWVGQFLVASPGLSDPNFRRAVIFLCQHSDEGALGFIVNRESDQRVQEALSMTVSESPIMDSPLCDGGPVGRDSVFILHDGSLGVDPPVIAGVGFGGDPELLRDLLERTSLGEEIEARLLAGYAGWGAGQLEFEVSTESWVLVPATAQRVFQSLSRDLWTEIMTELGGSYAFAAMAPEDPELN